VITNGSPVELNSVDQKAEAVLEAWYPGEEGGNAVADILFGDYNPSAKLPVTFVRSMDQLPDFRDYSMQNRTYRFMESDPLYPFGFGLSYTDFEYSDLKSSADSFAADEEAEITLTAKIKNTGKVKGTEVVQLYLKDLESSVSVPKYELRGVERVELTPNEAKTVEFKLKPRDFALINEDGKAVLETGEFEVYLGGSQPDSYSQQLTGKETLKSQITVKGKNVEFEY
jgi:beta-glucosidase